MKKLLPILLPLFCSAQCDLELLEFDPVLGTVTVAFNNTENCGGDGAPDGVSELQFGFQAIDEDCNAMNIGWDFPSFDFSQLYQQSPWLGIQRYDHRVSN